MATTQASRGGRFAASGKSGHKKRTGAGLQLLLSFLLLADLFLLYTFAMQLTHQQKVVEFSSTLNAVLVAVFAVGAVVLGAAVILKGAWKRAICLLLVFAALYLVAAFSDIPVVKKYREMWISTAMNTMRHQGLATYYFPASKVKEVTDREAAARSSQVGDNTIDDFGRDADDKSGWTDPPGETVTDESGGIVVQELSEEQKAFYRLFYELDRDSTDAWFKAHPEVLSEGYENILVNETSLEREGTTIRTKLGEKVLAIDAKSQILILEVDADGSRGVLAIAKDPSMLRLCAASSLPYYGQTVGKIAKSNDGVLAMTGSGFIDEGGVGNGGELAGFARCSGKDYEPQDDEHSYKNKWGYKRLELHEDNWLYLRDAFTDCSDNCTDAMEFQPGLLINGKKLDPLGWTGIQPRACIGQSSRGEILMLCVEGRRLASPGCSVVVCADILLQHDGINAINCDGGTTAIMWYRGEPIMRCSNSSTPQGRYLPNAWVIVP